jgi:exodeoxyribonuclease-3
MILLSPKLMAAATGSDVDYEVRAMEKPSDHAPLWCEIKVG